MAFVSVTRLRPRRARFLPAILLHTWRSRRQLRRAEGFLGGYLATSRGTTPWTPALWTVTLWRDEPAMRAFRNSGAHLKAMPLLIGACDEAAVTHWQSEHAEAPEPAKVAERMRGGRVSKVRHPSPEHAAGEAWPDGRVPVRGARLNLGKRAGPT
jgi:hypothetical protein